MPNFTRTSSSVKSISNVKILFTFIVTHHASSFTLQLLKCTWKSRVSKASFEWFWFICALVQRDVGISHWLWNIDWLVHIGLGRTVGSAAVVLICTFNSSFVSSCPQQAFKKVIYWVVYWLACAGPPWPESSIECCTSITWIFEQLMHAISCYWWAHFFQFISSCKAMINAV